DNIAQREHELVEYIFTRLENIPNLNLLAGQHRHRLGVISFYIDDLHYNLGVKILNDRFGIQTRGGCSCAGTYGHYLLHVDQETSRDLICSITSGDLIRKPGWIRMSIHPTTTDEEIRFVCEAIVALAENHLEWSKEYQYDGKTNNFRHVNEPTEIAEKVKGWFE
ncbi:MAG: aminotransferase class V-fold PLP-dependent enzyme, partial [Flavobacterium sp.]